jgi:hypothetical protein
LYLIKPLGIAAFRWRDHMCRRRVNDDDDAPIRGPQPEQPYRFENGAPYVPPPAPAPFVPDRNFDGDAIYGLQNPKRIPSAFPPEPAAPAMP